MPVLTPDPCGWTTAVAVVVGVASGTTVAPPPVVPQVSSVGSADSPPPHAAATKSPTTNSDICSLSALKNGARNSGTLPLMKPAGSFRNERRYFPAFVSIVKTFAVATAQKPRSLFASGGSDVGKGRSGQLASAGVEGVVYRITQEVEGEQENCQSAHRVHQQVRGGPEHRQAAVFVDHQPQAGYGRLNPNT